MEALRIRQRQPGAPNGALPGGLQVQVAGVTQRAGFCESNPQSHGRPPSAGRAGLFTSGHFQYNPGILTPGGCKSRQDAAGIAILAAVTHASHPPANAGNPGTDISCERHPKYAPKGKPRQHGAGGGCRRPGQGFGRKMPSSRLPAGAGPARHRTLSRSSRQCRSPRTCAGRRVRASLPEGYLPAASRKV